MHSEAELPVAQKIRQSQLLLTVLVGLLAVGTLLVGNELKISTGPESVTDSSFQTNAKILKELFEAIAVSYSIEIELSRVVL